MAGWLGILAKVGVPVAIASCVVAWMLQRKPGRRWWIPALVLAMVGVCLGYLANAEPYWATKAYMHRGWPIPFEELDMRRVTDGWKPDRQGHRSLRVAANHVVFLGWSQLPIFLGMAWKEWKRIRNRSKETT